jgi:hypothetical protein
MVAAAGIRIVQAVTEAGSSTPSFSRMQEWLDSIILCLVEAGRDDRSGFDAQLLREIDLAATVGDSVFLGQQTSAAFLQPGFGFEFASAPICFKILDRSTRLWMAAANVGGSF